MRRRVGRHNVSWIANFLKTWGQRNRAKRIAQPPLYVFYWTGAPSAPHEIRDISRTGAFIATDDHWYPGTVMHLIFQHAKYGTADAPTDEYFGVWAKVVRGAEGGLGVRFLWADRRERKGFQRFIERISEKAEEMIPETCDTARLTESSSDNHSDQAGSENSPVRGSSEPESTPNPAIAAAAPSDSVAVSPAAAGNGQHVASGVASGPTEPASSSCEPSRVRDSRAGSTLVEFAFVLLPLLTVIFGAIEMDRMLLVYTTLSNASRAGLRYATVHGKYRTQSGIDGPSSAPYHDNVDSTVRAIASAGLLDTSRLNVVVTYNVNNSGACLSPAYNNPGCRVSIATSYVYDPLSSFFPLSVTLRSTSQGVITF